MVSYHPGTYEGTGRGYGGKLIVRCSQVSRSVSPIFGKNKERHTASRT